MSTTWNSDESKKSASSALTRTASSSSTAASSSLCCTTCSSSCSNGGAKEGTALPAYKEMRVLQVGVREKRDRKGEWPLTTCFDEQRALSDRKDNKVDTEECALRRSSRGAGAAAAAKKVRSSAAAAAAAAEEDSEEEEEEEVFLSCCRWTKPRGVEIPSAAVPKAKPVLRASITRRQLTRQQRDRGGGNSSAEERLECANKTEDAAPGRAVTFVPGKKAKSGHSSADEVSLWSCDFSDCAAVSAATAAEESDASTYAVFALAESGGAEERGVSLRPSSKLVLEEGLFPEGKMPLKAPSPSVAPSSDNASSTSRQTVDTVNECIVRIDDADRTDSGCVLSGIWFSSGKVYTQGSSALYEEEEGKKRRRSKSREEAKEERAVVWGLEDRVDYSNDRNEALSRWSLGSEEYFANERKDSTKTPADASSAAAATPPAPPPAATALLLLPPAPEEKKSSSDDSSAAKLPPSPSAKEEPVTMVWSSDCKARCCNARCKHYFCSNAPQKVRSRPCAKKPPPPAFKAGETTKAEWKQCFIAEQSERIALKQQQLVRRQASATDKQQQQRLATESDDRSSSSASRRSSPTDDTSTDMRRRSVAPEFDDPPPPPPPRCALPPPPLAPALKAPRRSSASPSPSGSAHWRPPPPPPPPSLVERRRSSGRRCKKEASARSMTEDSTVWAVDDKPPRPISTDSSRVDHRLSSEKKSSKRSMKQLWYSDNKNSSEEGAMSDFYAVKKKDTVPATTAAPEVSTVWTLDGRHRLYPEQPTPPPPPPRRKDKQAKRSGHEDALTAAAKKALTPRSKTALWSSESPPLPPCLHNAQTAAATTLRRHHGRKTTLQQEQEEEEEDEAAATTTATLKAHRVRRVMADFEPVATLWSSHLSSETSDAKEDEEGEGGGGTQRQLKADANNVRWMAATTDDQSSLWTMESLTSNHRFPSDKCSICDAKSKGFGIGISTSDDSTVWTLDK